MNKLYSGSIIVKLDNLPPCEAWLELSQDRLYIRYNESVEEYSISSVTADRDELTVSNRLLRRRKPVIRLSLSNGEKRYIWIDNASNVQLESLYQILKRSIHDAQIYKEHKLTEEKLRLKQEEENRKRDEEIRVEEETETNRPEEELRLKQEEGDRKQGQEEINLKQIDEEQKSAEELHTGQVKEERKHAQEEYHQKQSEDEENQLHSTPETHEHLEQSDAKNHIVSENRREETDVAIKNGSSPYVFEKGDKVYFGKYPFDSDTDMQPIEWIVLQVSQNKALLITSFVIDRVPYNEDLRELTWEQCSLRKWLNKQFYNSAFSEEEKKSILLSEINNGPDSMNSAWKTDGGNTTKDKVFLLSHQEAESFFPVQSDRAGKGTKYAIGRGATISVTGDVWWWLRSPGRTQRRADRVTNGGQIGRCNRVQSSDEGVRPAIWVKLPNNTSINDTPDFDSAYVVKKFASASLTNVEPAAAIHSNDILPSNQSDTASAEPKVITVESAIDEIATRTGLHVITIKYYLYSNNIVSSSAKTLTEQQYNDLSTKFNNVCKVNSKSVKNDLSEKKPSNIEQDKISEQKNTSIGITVELTLREQFEEECKFLSKCVEKAISSPRIPQDKDFEHGEFLLDIINGTYSKLGDKYLMEFMPIYVLNPDNTLYPYHPYGLYSSDIYAPYGAFMGKKAKGQKSVLGRSIIETEPSSTEKICIMPDAVDDFNKQVRTECAGYFQIPRSIAAIYATRLLHATEESNLFFCIDYDGETTSVVEIDIVKDKGQDILLRKGRRRVEGKYYNYRDLAQEYLKRYQEKHHKSLSEDTIQKLINTKLLLKFLNNPEQKYMLDDGDHVVSIQADVEIRNEIMKLVLEDSEKLKLNEKLKGNVVILSVFGESDKFINAKDLKIGCEEILIRRRQGLVLWREYLPDLKLEVVRDGAFDSIQLISGKDHEQDIRQGAGYALDEEIEIKVVNGIISLPASPNNPCYNLPLERKIYGTDEPDKMAQFIVDKPLLEDKQVELWVYYKYGDAESYKLVAKIPGSDETIASKWEDIDSLKNDPPRYQYKNLNDKDVREKDREWISTQFNIFAKKITLQQRPRQEVIYPDGNGNHFLSNYINVGKWPYFQIQNCFRQDEYGISSRQLVEMNKAGILKCIWHTLDGSLPVGHNLGTVQPVAGGDPVREGKIIKEHISEVTRQMGVLFTLTKDDDPELPETIMGILNYYKTEGNKIENWAPITVYVKRDNDNRFSSA